MADTMTIEERLNLLFPGITKSRYSMGDVLPRRPRGVTPTQERTAQRMFSGYAYDPRVGRNVPGDPYAMMDQLNQMASKRGAARLEFEEEERRTAGLRSALESVYGPGVMEGIEAGPESVWPSLAGVRARRAEAERSAGIEAEDRSRRARMYRDMVVKRYPWMAEHLPPELGETDIMRVSDFMTGARREEDQAGIDQKMRQATQAAQAAMSRGDVETARRILATIGGAYYKGPQAMQMAEEELARLETERQEQEQAQVKEQEAQQKEQEKREQGAVKFATSLDAVVKKIRDLSIKEPPTIKPGPGQPWELPGGPKEIGAMGRELGNLLQQARSMAERAKIGGDILQQIIADALRQAGGMGPGEEERINAFVAQITGQPLPDLPGGMSWEQATGAEPFGDMSAADVQRAARLIADALDQFATQYMGQARQGR